MNTDAQPPMLPETVRRMEAHGGCRSELALQGYLTQEAHAVFADSLRRLNKFIDDWRRAHG